MTSAAPEGVPLPTVDPVGAFLTELISQLTTGVAPNLITSAAEAAVPELDWPFVKQIFEWMVGYVAGKISVVEQKGVLQVLFAVEKDSAEYAMLHALATYSAAQDSGDPDAISKSLEDAVNEWGDVIHFGGAAPVIGG